MKVYIALLISYYSYSCDSLFIIKTDVSLFLSIILVNFKLVCYILSKEVLKWFTVLRLMFNDVAIKWCRYWLTKKRFKELDLNILMSFKNLLKFNN